jgi:hypothetical protein
MQGWFHICKSINIIQHLNRIKDKNNIIISIDAEKAFDKMTKLGTEGKYFNEIKTIYGKPIANVILSREKLVSYKLKIYFLPI